MGALRFLLKSLLCATLILGAASCGPATGDNDDPAEFYRGKTITVIVGYAAGGGYDQSARVLSRYLGKYMPGHPTVIVQNMPGAGTLVAANHLYNAAPRDGTAIGIVSDLMIVAPLVKMKGAQYDPREVGYLGSLTTRGTTLVFVRHDAPATTIEEARHTEVSVGASGPDASATYPRMVNELLGTKFKTILGYVSGAEIDLAIERGEVHGRGGYDWTGLKHDHPEWIKNKFIVPVLQLALTPDPDLPGVPVAINIVKTEEDRQLLRLIFGYDFQRTFSAPPGVPPARLAALREAFKKMSQDPAFQKEAGVFMYHGLRYTSPEQIRTFIDTAYAMPQSVITRAGKFIVQ